MPPRPAGTDGRDHAFRMVIENRYKRLAQNRKRLRFLAITQNIFTIIRLCWHSIPWWSQGTYPTQQSQVISAAGLIALPLYLIGAGGGQAQQEKLWVMVLYSIHCLSLGMVILSTYLYNSLQGFRSPIPELLAEYAQDKYGWEHDNTRLTAAFSEGIFDVIGIGVLFGAAFVSYSYVSFKVDSGKKK